MKVLASDQTLKIQVGANDGESIDINLKEITSSTLGLGNLDVTNKGLDLSKLSSAALTNAKPSSTIDTASHALKAKDTASATDYDLYVDDGDASKLYVKSATGTEYYAVTGYDSDTGSLKFNSGTAVTPTGTATAVTAGQNVNVDGTTIANSDNLTFADSATAATPSFNVGTDGKVYVTVGTKSYEGNMDKDTGVVSYNSAGGDVDLATVDGETAATTLDVIGSTTPAVALKLDGITDLGDNPQVFSVKGGGYVIKGTENGADAYYSATIKDDGTVVKGDELNSDPLAAIDKALAQVDSLRSDLGAVQNRFDSTITNLGNTVNNLSSARSRIEDADYATEVSNMSRAQILQQAGTSVLAQANQTTQNVLSLLR